MTALHDITTDVLDPPAFVDVLAHRRWALNPPAYPGAEAGTLQRRLYPAIVPLHLQHPRAAVHAAARALIGARGWTLLGDVATDGRLEAVAITPWLRFRDDIVLRLRESPDGTRVDMRSASRLGRNDFGANARRIHAFLDDLARELEAGVSRS